MNTFNHEYPSIESDVKMLHKAKGDLAEDITGDQAFGSGFNHWIEVQIYPRNSTMRSFVPHLIQKNLTTH